MMDHERMDTAIDQMLERTPCSRCGGRLRLHHVLTKQQFVALIETRCCDCERAAKTLCFDGEALKSMRSELERGAFGGACESRPRVPESIPTPVTSDDVSSVALFLDTFDGDFGRLFEKP